MGMGISVARHGDQAVDKVGALRRSRDRNWPPAQLIRWGRHLVERRAAQPSRTDGFEWLMRHRGTHPVKPRPAIDAARRCECRATQLLRVQPMRNFLRRILPARQYAIDRLAGELVAESRLITERRRRWRLLFYTRRSRVSHRLQIPSSRLLHFDRFKERFEIPFAKSAAALALDDFEKHGRPIFHRLRKNLQEVPFLVAVHKYTERAQLCQRFLHGSDPRRQRLIIGVGNAKKIEPIALQFAYRVDNIFALQRDVLRARSSVSLDVFLNLALVARWGRFIDRKFHRMRIVR